MIAVILAGGSGTRLWPLSQPHYPKHLLPLTADKSLLQCTVERAEKLTDIEHIYVISAASHIEHIYEQLPELSKNHVIVEPDRRGTASCVIAALALIKESVSASEPIIFMSADHHVTDEDKFVEAVLLAGSLSLDNNRIVLLGSKPTFPATGFGYIETSDAIGERAYKVTGFKEKPDAITAEAYLSTGRYLWNMGYFIAPLAVFESQIEQYAPDLWRNYRDLLLADSTKEYESVYLAFKNEQIDTALSEKMPELLVVSDIFGWSDVGSFGDLHTIRPSDEFGNTVSGSAVVMETSNSLIENNTEIPLAVIGVDNAIVVVTGDGILVTTREHTQLVGEAAKRM